MFLAEWKKLLRQRWFLLLTAGFLAVHLALFVYRQQDGHSTWLNAVSWYDTYSEQILGMETSEARSWLMAESGRLGDLQGVYLVQKGEIDVGFLELLLMSNPNLVAEYEESGYAEHPQDLQIQMTAAVELNNQLSMKSVFANYLAMISANYEQMKSNAFYEEHPYALAVGEKTVADFSGLDWIEPRPGMTWGVEAMMEHVSGDLLLVLLLICVCALTMTPERNKELFGLLKSCKRGRVRLAVIKYLTVISAAVLLCLIFYGSLALTAGRMYGFGDLSRPMQSIGSFSESNRTLSVGGFLLDCYGRNTLGMIAIACLTETLLILFASPVISLGAAAAIGGICAVCNQTFTNISSMAILHFINPVEWFNRTECYGEYWLINLFGKPVNILFVNLCFILIVFVLSAAGGVSAFCLTSMSGKSRRVSLLQRLIGLFIEHLPYPAGMVGQEWRKQLIKNRVLILCLLAALVLWGMTENRQANLDPVNRQYQLYINSFKGPMTEETMAAIQEEQDRLDGLREKLAQYAQQFESGEITEEYFKAVQTLIDGELKKQEALDRVTAQANDLMAYEAQYGRQLALADENAGSYLLEQRAFDQRQGLIVLLILTVLLTGIFPGDQMLMLLRATKRGMKPLFAAKIALGILLAVLAAGGMTVSRIASAGVLYGFGDWTIPVQSFPAARQLTADMRLNSFLLTTALMQSAGICCLAACFLSLSVWMKNQLYAMLTEMAVFALPLLLGTLGVAFPWEYLGNRIFFFPYQTAAHGFGGQVIYLLAALAAAALFVNAGWRKYQNKEHCVLPDIGRFQNRGGRA